MPHISELVCRIYFVGLQAVYVAVGRYGDVFGNHAEVVAYQVYNRGMFGSFFGIVQQD